MHQAMAATVEDCIQKIREIQQECRRTGVARRPHWPMIVSVLPKDGVHQRKCLVIGSKVLGVPTKFRCLM